MMRMKMLAAALLTMSLGAAGRGLLAAPAGDAGVTTSKVAAMAVPTFNCLSVYWSPENGAAGKKVLVKFRAVGNAADTAWHEGLSMRYNPVKTPECKGDYRGSIVNLTPGTNYEVALTLEGTDIRTSLKAATWSDKFPVASTVKCPSGSATIAAKTSGSPNGYVLYDGTGCTIDGADKIDFGVAIDANYVILRGFTIKNVKQDCIRINTGHHVVIENCDLSKWGSEDKQHVGFGVEMQSGVYSRYKQLHNVVIQRCKIHNPNWTSNSWAQDHFPGKPSRHPDGPQTITFWDPQGNNVIRYNECWSDKDHHYNDVMGGAFNGSYRGWPGADSDIYCNYVADCWDDGIESEGGNQNVRIWDNYIENTMMMIANAATSIGPLYIWQNVTGRSYSPPGSEYNMTHGNFMKMGYADSVNWMTGHMYVFNNTILQPNNEGANGLGGESRIIKHCVTRNNILHVRPKDTRVIATDKKTPNGPTNDDDFDYDLISADRFPPNSEEHAIKGTPKYASSAGFNEETKTGDFELAPDSPGKGKATVIPDFCDPVKGSPDMGAQQPGTPPMVFGVKANFVPPPLPAMAAGQ